MRRDAHAGQKGQYVLATLTSSHFAIHEGTSLLAETTAGDLPLEIIGVKENPLAAAPNAARMPFDVLLRGAVAPCLVDGCYAMRVDGDNGWRLEGVYLSRIVQPRGIDGPGAFYQVVFN